MAHSGTIVYMRTVPGKPIYRALTKRLHYYDRHGKKKYIPVDFESDGSSVPRPFTLIIPRHEHPIAFFRHDFRCAVAENDEDRKFADEEYEKDLGRTSWWITKKVGYLGVRVGAMLGIGNRF